MTTPWEPAEQVADHALRLSLPASAIAAGPSPASSAAVRAAVFALTAEPLPGLSEVTPGYATLLIRFVPLRVDPQELAARVAERLAGAAAQPLPPPRHHQVPVCYGGEHGPDLDAVAAALGLSPRELIACHSQPRYQVAFLGFAPGFPYLLGLPRALQQPRRATPRTSVPAGSVAIAGAQAGIYPQASPGGWQLLGRTPLSLFQPTAQPMARLQLGDTLCFQPQPASEFSAPAQAEPPLHPSTAEAALTVLSPGALSTVQDLGRPGWSPLGLSAGGAADPLALRLANRLLQNPDGAAALELTLTGPQLRAERDLDFALIGAPAASIDGVPIASGTTQTLRRGQVLRCAQLGPGLRGYLAVRGGLAVPLLAGSAATDLRGQLGGLAGRALQRGDTLAVSAIPASATTGRNFRGRLSPQGEQLLAPSTTLRVTRGAQADWFAEPLSQLGQLAWLLSPQSNRSGLRLQSASPLRLSPRGQATGSLLSEGVTAGALQVPADGQPILLGVEQQSTGGYPKLAQVISADLPLLGRLRPGQPITFVPVSFAEAARAYGEQLAALAQAIVPLSACATRSRP